MTKSSRVLLRFAFVATTVVVLMLLTSDEQKKSTLQADVLEATAQKQWYRGNLHTHSLWSDGDDYLEMIARWYKDHDYDFLTFTDHNVLATNQDRWVDISKKKTGKEALEKLEKAFPGGWVEKRTVDGRTEVRLKTYSEVVAKVGVPGDFLLIQGEEITDRFKNFPIHMNATNVKSLIPPLHGESVAETIQNNVNALVAQRERTKQPMIIHLNHPNFGYGVTAEDLMRIRGEKFFEVYNGHPGVNDSGDKDHVSTERIWDIILTKRLAEFKLPVMYGLATDDGHNYHRIPSRSSEPGRGWVEVLADELSPASLIASLERGDFYSSSGVTLTKVVSSQKRLDVEVAPKDGVTYRIEFIGSRIGYETSSEPVRNAAGKEIRATRKYSDDIGRVLKTVEGTSGSYDIAKNDIYVRARVVSSKKHPNPSEPGEFERAWIQPVVGPAAVSE